MGAEETVRQQANRGISDKKTKDAINDIANKMGEYKTLSRILRDALQALLSKNAATIEAMPKIRLKAITMANLLFNANGPDLDPEDPISQVRDYVREWSKAHEVVEKILKDITSNRLKKGLQELKKVAAR
jgi:hypothetical protein